MDLDRFIRAHQPSWRRLETQLAGVGTAGLRSLAAGELRELGAHYRQASSDLVYVRSVLQNAELEDYLNQLVGAAYGAIYQKSRLTWKETRHFLVHGFPTLVRQHIVAMIVSTVVSLAALGVGGAAVLCDPDAFAHFVPSAYHALYGKRPKDLREERFKNIDPNAAAAFSGHIMTNNMRVSFLAFAMGITFGAFTFIVLFYNGAMLGAIAANFWRWDMNLDFWSLILPHGGIELSCIFIAGGAGFILASALIRPGRRTRADALAAAGRDAVLIALGVAPWLVIAGLIEGFFTPLAAVGPWPKVGFGIVTGAAFWAYLLVPRRSHA